MYIIAPEEWGSPLDDWKLKGTDYCKPKSNSYFMPCVAENDSDLEDFVQNFQNGL